MVSPTTTNTASDIASPPPLPLPRRDRGIAMEEIDVVVGRAETPLVVHRPFWSYVVAGTVSALSLFVLSWYLMLGFHIGITDAGIIDLGAGAAIWLWITSCLVFLIGGRMSTIMAPMSRVPLVAGVISGASVWALSIPLAILAYDHSEFGGVFSNMTAPYPVDPAEVPSAHVAFHLAMFLTLLIGLASAIIGGISGYFVRIDSPSLPRTSGI